MGCIAAGQSPLNPLSAYPLAANRLLELASILNRWCLSISTIPATCTQEAFMKTTYSLYDRVYMNTTVPQNPTPTYPLSVSSPPPPPYTQSAMPSQAKSSSIPPNLTSKESQMQSQPPSLNPIQSHQPSLSLIHPAQCVPPVAGNLPNVQSAQPYTPHPSIQQTQQVALGQSQLLQQNQDTQFAHSQYLKQAQAMRLPNSQLMQHQMGTHLPPTQFIPPPGNILSTNSQLMQQAPNVPPKQQQPMIQFPHTPLMQQTPIAAMSSSQPAPLTQPLTTNSQVFINPPKHEPISRSTADSHVLNRPETSALSAGPAVPSPYMPPKVSEPTLPAVPQKISSVRRPTPPVSAENLADFITLHRVHGKKITTFKKGSAHWLLVEDAQKIYFPRMSLETFLEKIKDAGVLTCELSKEVATAFRLHYSMLESEEFEVNEMMTFYSLTEIVSKLTGSTAQSLNK